MKFLIALIASLLVSTQATPDYESFILGGLPAEIEEVPHQVALLIDFWYVGTYVHICGGSIVRNNAILTAYQCTFEAVPVQLKVRAGSKYHNEGGVLVDVSDIASPGEFDVRLRNDISIVFLAEPLVYGSTIAPVSLPGADLEVSPGTYGVISGWGRVSEEGLGSVNLQKAAVAIVNYTECAYLMRSFVGLTTNSTCAGNINSDGTDSCEGDTGGPLTVGAALFGIRSFGKGCGRNGFPGVYTKVSAFANWINSVLNRPF